MSYFISYQARPPVPVSSLSISPQYTPLRRSVKRDGLHRFTTIVNYKVFARRRSTLSSSFTFTPTPSPSLLARTTHQSTYTHSLAGRPHHPGNSHPTLVTESDLLHSYIAMSYQPQPPPAAYHMGNMAPYVAGGPAPGASEYCSVISPSQS